jgi:hypothetical protein
MKIAEEAGVAVAAYIGLTGANPRKGVSSHHHDRARDARRDVDRQPGSAVRLALRSWGR